MLPSAASGRADCAACNTGGKDELVSVRIVRPLEGRARLAVAAGFRLGARPAALAPSQQDRFCSLTQRAFADVLHQAASAGCQAFVCGGGLFADTLPSLDHVRAAMAPLGSARRAGITIIATGDSADQNTDGTSFLADVGLIDTVLDARGPDTTLISAANLQIALVTGGARGHADGADLVFALDTPGCDADEPAAMAANADVVIDTRACQAAFDRLGDVPVIATGWAGPSFERDTQPGFVVLDIDARNGVVPSFVETEAIRPAQLVIDSPQTGSEIDRLIAPELGAVGILDVKIQGRVLRSVWHDADPERLIDRASAAGTLLRFDIEGMVVVESASETGLPEHPSFLVNARRVSERLLTSADDEIERDVVAAARSRIVEIARRREPTKAVT